MLARSARTALGDVADAMYGRQSLVRWMTMRRTLFLVPRDDVPAVQAAVLADRGADADRAIEAAAARLHRRLDGAVVTPAARTPLERPSASDLRRRPGGWLPNQ